jgi:hypothetical protein
LISKGNSTISTAGENLRLARSYAFECCEQWHLADLSPVCSLIYPFAYKLTRHTTKPFFPSARTLAGYFDRSESQIRRGLKELLELGFFELIRAGKFQTNTYRVLGHTEWAKIHPGQCASKETFPYTNDGDPLGQELWAETGGRIRFQQFQIDNLRNLQLEDTIIKERFAGFWKETGHTLKVQAVSPYFFKTLQDCAHGVQI